MADVQLALCRVLLPRLWRPISVLLHVLRSTDDRGRRLSTRELPLLFPMNAIEENESASGCALAQRWGWGRRGGGFCEREGEVFTCPFHPPVNINGEGGEITVIAAAAAQSLLIAFWTLTCLFFPLQGNQMFSHSVTDSLPDCPKPFHTRLPCTRTRTHAHVPFPYVFWIRLTSIPCYPFAPGQISVHSGDVRCCRVKKGKKRSDFAYN